MTSMELKASNLRSGYDQIEVVRVDSLVVKEQSVLALFGPNGAGKTTLLRTIAGLVPASSGTITLGGVDITDAKAPQRASQGICFIPEGRAIFPNLSVEENIRMHSLNSPLSFNEATTISLEAFPRLGNKLKQTSGTLSGGEQQMLALSRALISPARLILADELSMGLAPNIVADIFQVIDRIKKEGRSILLVEQYVDIALAAADEVAILRRGALDHLGAAQGVSRAEVYEHFVS